MILNKFETVVIINGNLSESAADEVILKYVHKFNEWAAPVIKLGYTPVVCDRKGKKNLAYEIKKQKQGWYYIVHFWSAPENIEELDRLYRIDENILKFMTFKEEKEDEKIIELNLDPTSEQNSNPDDHKHHPLGQNHYDYLFGYTDEFKT